MREAETARSLLNRIGNQQATFFRHIMKREDLKHPYHKLQTRGNERKRQIERFRAVFQLGWTPWKWHAWYRQQRIMEPEKTKDHLNNGARYGNGKHLKYYQNNMKSFDETNRRTGSNNSSVQTRLYSGVSAEVKWLHNWYYHSFRSLGENLTVVL